MRALAPPMTDSARPSIVVVGGGVTGLVAAYTAHRARPDASVVLFEARARLGGNIVTDRVQGFLLDGGPDSFIRTKPDALALCRELGLDHELTPTRDVARHVFIAHDGRLERMPGGMALAVPTRIGPLLETKLLGPLGKLRMLAEPLVPRRHADTEESIESFFTRRVGREATLRLAAPLLGGIYAGDPRALSVRATFPQLVALEEKYGSLLRGFLALELARGRGEGGERPSLRDVYAWLKRGGTAQAPSPFLALKSGMGTLIDALARSLPEGSVHAGSPVTAIRRVAGGFEVDADGRAHFAHAVIAAAPAHVTAALVPDEGLARELAGIPYVSTATVFFALDRSRVKHDLQGFGFIVPEGEAKVLASTWVSSKWEERVPEGGVLVRAFLGGARDPELVQSSTDEALVLLARSELERFMGPLGEARFTRVFRYTQAGPQPNVGHLARLARIAAELRKIPGLYVAGAAYHGVGIPDCVRQARSAALSAVEHVSFERRTEAALV